jgi:peptidoglycan glycosyltransferase
MDRLIRRLGLALTVLFLLLIAQISYLQVFHAGAIADNPANATRQLIAEYRVDRGPILAADGKTELAYSRKSRGELVYQRVYPDGPLYSGITGFYSLVYGRTGLESAMNSYLSGDAPELAAQTFSDLLLGRPKKGGAVVTTIDPALQQAAARALGNEPGAVVALNPQTGDILALVANPTYDPNPLSSQDPKVVRRTWEHLNADPNHPLTNRAVAELFPPGSTFKLVTASAALQNGDTTSTRYPNPHTLDLPLTNSTIQNFGGEICPGGSTTDLLTAFTDSCNVIFGEVGLKLGAQKLSDQANAFGFCPTDPTTSGACLQPTVPVIPFGQSSWFQTGRFPEASYFQGRDPEVAISAIGQDNDLANPMQMALVGQAIANNGQEMVPKLVNEVRDASGRVVKTYDPQVYGHPISSRTASEMTTMMENVVSSGTGTAANIPGCNVAGKTGTAQHATGAAPHAWFVSFAPNPNPKIVVAVIVLDGGSLGQEATGGQVSAPIAKQVIEASGACG